MPRVSVILPTYNRARLLPRAVQSVLVQTFRDFELLIVDDGSMDNTAEVVAGIDDSRTHYQRIDHRGCAAARNRGCESSKGELLAFIDSDDEWLPTKLDRQVAVLDSHGPEVGVVCTAGLSFDDVSGQAGRVHRVKVEGVGWLFDRLLERPGGVTLPSAVARLECYTRVGPFDESLRSKHDREWLLRVTKEFAVFGISEPLIIAHEHEGPHLSDDIRAGIAFEEVMLQRYAEELRTRPQALRQTLMRLGGLRLKSGDGPGAAGDFFQAVRVHPLHLPAYFYLLISLLGGRGPRIAARLKRLIRPLRSRSSTRRR